MFRLGRYIKASAHALGDNSDEVGTNTPGSALFADIVQRDWRTVTDGITALAPDRPIGVALRPIGVMPDLILHLTIDDFGIDPSFPALFLSQPPGTDEWDFDGVCGVGALDG